MSAGTHGDCDLLGYMSIARGMVIGLFVIDEHYPAADINNIECQRSLAR